MTLDIVIAVLVVLALAAGWLYLAGTRNSLVRERNELGKAWTNLDQLLKQRRDELHRLIGTCRGYLKDGSSLLAPVAASRTAEQKAQALSEKARAAAELSEALRALFAAGDRDAALGLDTSYRQLKKAVLGLDERIEAERARFNQQAIAFNARLAGVRGRLAARGGRLRPQAHFDARGVAGT